MTIFRRDESPLSHWERAGWGFTFPIWTW